MKAVVDAYDGTVTLYVVDDEGPDHQGLPEGVPRPLHADDEDAPAELRAHLRYPEDLFTVQTQMWAKYHVRPTPTTFYNGNDEWNVAHEPGVTSSTRRAGRPVGPDGRADHPERPLPVAVPAHAAPGREKESFVILRPYVAASSVTTPRSC